MESAHIEHDLFLLMIQLSQIQDQNLIKRVFLESVNAIHPDLAIAFSDPNFAGQPSVMAIATTRRTYGYVRFTKMPQHFSDELQALIRNALTMLALILENRYNDRLVNDEKLLLQEAVAEKTTSLQKNHEKFLTILDSIDATIYVADMETYEILFMNKKMNDLFGGDRTGQICYQVFRKESYPCRHCTNDRLIGSDGMPSGLCTWNDQNPVTGRFYINHDRAVEWIDGRLVRLQIATDITDVKQLEKRLAQAQKMESIGSLASGIAHDFNNLLFPIVGISELLLEDLPSGSPEHENIREILRAGKRGRDLVNQILAFSRQTGEEMIPVRVQQMIKEVLTLCRSTIPAHITITRYIQPDCPPVMADPTQIHQVAMNLITNAFHAVEGAEGKSGGTIDVQFRQTELTQQDMVESDLEPGQYATLSVSDNGCGIPPEAMTKIFDPYFTTKEKGKGTGLGLSVVHGIVKAHKGDIHVRSNEGSGTSFTIYLPVIKQPVHAQPGEKNDILSPGDEHILLVDDENAIVQIETQILERIGYQTTSFTDSNDALTAFQADPESFDLVLTDMAMPHMNGEELAGKLIAIRPDIPIIMCTGFSARTNHDKTQAAGVKALLMKPVIRSDLAKAVRMALDEAK